MVRRLGPYHKGVMQFEERSELKFFHVKIKGCRKKSDSRFFNFLMKFHQAKFLN